MQTIAAYRTVLCILHMIHDTAELDLIWILDKSLYDFYVMYVKS